MKRVSTMWVACCLAPLVVSAAPAWAVITDDLESYTPGDPADTANPTAFSPIAANPVGSIAAGLATANVASSNVLEHNSGSGVFTRVNSADLSGEVTVSFDFVVTAGEHNLWVRDASNGLEGVLIRFLAGDATRYFVQVQGSTGSSPQAYEDLVDYGDWVRATINLHLDANPALSSFDVAFHNLTEDAALLPHAGTGSASTFQGLSLINQIQIESAGGGQVQFDNFVVPEPASIALCGLGLVAIGARRRG